MELECGCIIDGRDKHYKKMCLQHIKEREPNVNGWEGKQTNAPYECMRCGNKSGWSWIEPKHNCNNPMFDKKGNLREDYNASLLPTLKRRVSEKVS